MTHNAFYAAAGLALFVAVVFSIEPAADAQTPGKALSENDRRTAAHAQRMIEEGGGLDTRAMCASERTSAAAGSTLESR